MTTMSTVPESLLRRIEELYRAVKACRREAREADVHALERALDLASMHLHHALWVLGADVGLSPDFDDPSDDETGERGEGGRS